MYRNLGKTVITLRGPGRVRGVEDSGRLYVALESGGEDLFEPNAVVFPPHKPQPKPTEKQIYQSALNKFGHPSQINKMIEECSELITAICHHRISRAADDEVCEELADVEIMLGQMRLIFGADNVERMKQKKIDRLAERTGLKLALYGVCG